VCQGLSQVCRERFMHNAMCVPFLFPRCVPEPSWGWPKAREQDEPRVAIGLPGSDCVWSWKSAWKLSRRRSYPP
jgi:hypothetical protein